ncbi:MAG: NADH-quinone oxidoreductase subunit L [Gammaproteobacteria bacterium]|nr:NADH-quinone oxidoreductase subunit L [Gammaproteobacteria bacterium]
MDQVILAIVGLPVLSAVLTYLLAPQFGQNVARISVAISIVVFLLASVLLAFAVFGEVDPHLELGDGWAILLVDPLSTLMLFVVTGISLVVHVYSVRYMAEEEGYARFFALLDLMTFALLLMVSAGDLVTLLVAWHLVGILLYLLLGQDTRSLSAQRYAQWTLLTYRIGDLPLLLAAVLLFQAYETWSLTEIFAQIAEDSSARTMFDLPLIEVVGALVAFSAFARSAQFFLHTWLPYTMAGPTPVSALMHAGIVNAGGFLLNRFAPVLIATDSVLHWVFVVGLVTAVIGSVLMLAQSDIKKALGYSTMGQMGFMIMECGVGAFSLAVYHLIAHGLFKGTLFLGAGGVIGEARANDGVPKDHLYTFIIERRPARTRQPWLVMAAITLAVPMTILFLAHWLVAQDFFQKQGAVVLLFFGWVTGAQLIFATYRMQTENIWRLMTLILFSFAVVVVGYTLISHAFDLFLYPDPVFRAQLYATAGIDIIWFDALVVLVTAFVILGWLMKYYAEQKGNSGLASSHGIRRLFFTVVTREFFLIEFYSRVSRWLVALATRINVVLRWS